MIYEIRMTRKTEYFSSVLIFATIIFFTALFLAGGSHPVFADSTTLWQQVRAQSFAKLGDVPQQNRPSRIGAIIITMANPFWVTVKDGYEYAAKELEVKVDVQAAPQENSVAAQLDILENMVSKGYDAIVAHSITRHNLIPGMVKAASKGVPVVTDSIRVDMKAAREAGAKPIDIALVDFYAQGKTGGAYIVAQLKKKGGGKVAIIEGLPGAPQSEARRDGARDAFKTEASINLVSIQPGNWDRQKAYNITTNLIQSHPDLKAVMCANDVMALAAVEAAEAKGMKDKLLIVGIDFIDQAKEAIEKGRLDASVAQAPFIIGELCLRAAIKAAARESIPQELYIPIILVTRENLGDFKDWK